VVRGLLWVHKPRRYVPLRLGFLCSLGRSQHMGHMMHSCWKELLFTIKGGMVGDFLGNEVQD